MEIDYLHTFLEQWGWLIIVIEYPINWVVLLGRF